MNIRVYSFHAWLVNSPHHLQVFHYFPLQRTFFSAVVVLTGFFSLIKWFHFPCLPIVIFFPDLKWWHKDVVKLFTFVSKLWSKSLFRTVDRCFIVFFAPCFSIQTCNRSFFRISMFPSRHHFISSPVLKWWYEVTEIDQSWLRLILKLKSGCMFETPVNGILLFVIWSIPTGFLQQSITYTNVALD